MSSQSTALAGIRVLVVEVAGVEQSFVLIQSDLCHRWENSGLGFNERLGFSGTSGSWEMFVFRDEALRI